MGDGDRRDSAREMKFPTDQIMKPNHLKFSATLAALLAFAPAAFPHAGHDKAPGEDGNAATTGPNTSSRIRRWAGLVVWTRVGSMK